MPQAHILDNQRAGLHHHTAVIASSRRSTHKATSTTLSPTGACVYFPSSVLSTRVETWLGTMQCLTRVSAARVLMIHLVVNMASLTKATGSPSSVVVPGGGVHAGFERYQHHQHQRASTSRRHLRVGSGEEESKLSLNEVCYLSIDCAPGLFTVRASLV